MLCKKVDRSDQERHIGMVCYNLTPIDQQTVVRSISSSATHCGLVRRGNQDAILDRSDMDLWAVADGVGSLGGGERASRAVIAALERIEPGENYGDDIARQLVTANRELRLEAVVDRTRAAATTVVALVTDRSQQRFTCIWVGDSRLYRLRGGNLVQITQDHTPMQEIGPIAGIRLSNPSLKDALSRAIGKEEQLHIGRIEGDVKPGDIFLLCTDGLSKPVGSHHISSVLSTSPPALAAQYLVDAALMAGGPDNVSAIVVSFPKEFRAARWCAWPCKMKSAPSAAALRRAGSLAIATLVVSVALAAITLQQSPLRIDVPAGAMIEKVYEQLVTAIAMWASDHGWH